MSETENQSKLTTRKDDRAPDAGRRAVVAGGLALGTVGAFAQPVQAKTQTAPSKGADVVEVAAKCVVAGELCMAHCNRLIAAGDTTMARCLEAALVMTSVCQSMMTLAAVESPVFKQMGAVAMATCNTCRDECEKHAMHHAECEACMVACKETVGVLMNSDLMKT